MTKLEPTGDHWSTRLFTIECLDATNRRYCFTTSDRVKRGYGKPALRHTRMRLSRSGLGQRGTWRQVQFHAGNRTCPCQPARGPSPPVSPLCASRRCASLPCPARPLGRPEPGPVPSHSAGAPDRAGHCEGLLEGVELLLQRVFSLRIMWPIKQRAPGPNYQVNAVLASLAISGRLSCRRVPNAPNPRSLSQWSSGVAGRFHGELQHPLALERGGARPGVWRWGRALLGASNTICWAAGSF